MISVADAIASVLAHVSQLDTERVRLESAFGRVLAEAVEADRDIPPFRNSAMDGYAVSTSSLQHDPPYLLEVQAVVAAGSPPSAPLQDGKAIKIMTGAVMPEGADTVVRVEDTEETPEGVSIRVTARPGDNVRFPGEDIRKGERVLTVGRKLRPADLGLIASLGISEVSVYRVPEVAILSTGDELVDVDQPPKVGQIVNSNAYALLAAIEEAGASGKILGIAPDTEVGTREFFETALSSDVVVSTGGVSMGTFDLVRKVLASLGVEEKFWKVAQRPGKPISFGLRKGCPVFGLPGNPVSSLVCFYLFVRPALLAMQGNSNCHLPVVAATLEHDLRSKRGLTEFVRCFLVGNPEDGSYRARSTGSQSSGVLRSLSEADGLMIVPAETDAVDAGSPVRVLLLRAKEVPTLPS